jgi:septal ring factor EnvC (AmiA/AmiB activator)
MAQDLNTKMQVDVEVLKRDVDTLTKLCEKMDKVIEKIVTHQEVLINQIYQDMDRRKQDTNDDIKELHSRITTVNRELTDELKSTEDKIMAEIKSLRQEIKEHNAKEDSELEKILKWKWSIVGGILVISWLTSNLDFVTMLIGK